MTEIVIDSTLVATALALLILTMVPLIQALAFTFLRRRPSLPTGLRIPAAVLVPAHNEAASIKRTVENVKAQMIDGDRLLVVADNCSDATAAVAREAGAEVVERASLHDRGKGFALDFGLRHLLASGAPDVVVIVDADCQLQEGALHRLVEACQVTQRPAQALYDMRNRQTDSAEGNIGAMAWQMNSHVRPCGYARLGMPCQLMGTGMAFPTAQLAKSRLATGHVAEDLQLGVDLAIAGHPPLLVPDAVVTSEFPTSDAARSVQKTRWIHGHLSVIVNSFPPLLAAGLRRRSLPIVALAFDLAVPPLGLLIAAILVMLLMSGIYDLAGGGAVPLLITSAALLQLGAALALALIVAGRQKIGLSEFLVLPRHIAHLAGIAIRYVIGERSAWTRTERK